MKNANPDAVVHWGDAVEGALVLNTMREMGMTQPFFGCDRTVNDEFVKLAGKNADGRGRGISLEPRAEGPEARALPQGLSRSVRHGSRNLRRARLRRDEHDPVLAINVAGLNRAKIRDLIAYAPHPWPGVTGDIVFSACLDDVADTYLATYEHGAWKYVSRSELGIRKGYIAPRDRLNREVAACRPRPRRRPRRRRGEPSRASDPRSRFFSFLLSAGPPPPPARGFLGARPDRSPSE